MNEAGPSHACASVVSNNTKEPQESKKRKRLLCEEDRKFVSCWTCRRRFKESDEFPCLFCGLEMFCSHECRAQLNNLDAEYPSVCNHFLLAKRNLGKFLGRMANKAWNGHEDYLHDFRPFNWWSEETLMEEDENAARGVIAVVELAVIYQYSFMVTRKKIYLLASLQSLSSFVAQQDTQSYTLLLMLVRQALWAEETDLAVAMLNAIERKTHEARRFPIVQSARLAWVSGDVHKYISSEETGRSIIEKYFLFPHVDIKDMHVDPEANLCELAALALLITAQKYYFTMMDAMRAREVLAPVLQDAPAVLVAKHLTNEQMFQSLAEKFAGYLDCFVGKCAEGLSDDVRIPVPPYFSWYQDAHLRDRFATVKGSLKLKLLIRGLDYEGTHLTHTLFGENIRYRLKAACKAFERRKIEDVDSFKM